MTQMSTATLTGAMKDNVTTLDEVKRAADEYNKIGAARREERSQASAPQRRASRTRRLPDGRRTYFALMEHFDPKLVFMQFQMSSMRSAWTSTRSSSSTPILAGSISLHVQGVNMNPPPAYVSPAAAAAAAAAPAGGSGSGLRQLAAWCAGQGGGAAGCGRPRMGSHLRSRQGRRSPELLRRAELAVDGCSAWRT